MHANELREEVASLAPAARNIHFPTVHLPDSRTRMKAHESPDDGSGDLAGAETLEIIQAAPRYKCAGGMERRPSGTSLDSSYSRQRFFGWIMSVPRLPLRIRGDAEERSLPRGTWYCMRSCPGCGGQFSPHTSVCPWCGRSVVLGMIVQLGVAAVLLAGVATFTGIIDWSKVLHSVAPEGVSLTSEPPQNAGHPARDEGTPLLDRAFNALPPPPPKGSSDRPPSCSVADSARLSRLGHGRQDWDDQVRALISCRQVRPGFNVDELRAALGRPAKVVQRESGEEEWIYNQQRVVVKDGRVTAIER
jgi:hypothetical protein